MNWNDCAILGQLPLVPVAPKPATRRPGQVVYVKGKQGRLMPKIILSPKAVRVLESRWNSFDSMEI